MPIKVYDSKDAVPEAQRDAAIETKDGKFAVSEDNTTDVTNLTSALAKEREKAKLEEKARKDAEKERDDLKRVADAKAKGITEEQLAEIQRKEAEARKPLEEKLAKTEAENRKLKLTDRVKAMALAKGVMPDRIDKAMKDLDGRLDLTEDGSSIVVKDAAGQVTAEPWEKFLEVTYKKEAPFFYAGTNGSGGGSGGSNGSAEADPDAKAKRDAATKAEKASAVASAF